MSKEEMTIEELQRELEQGFTIPSALQTLLPPGFRPHVSLYGPNQKMRKNACAKNWSPESGEIHIRFERDEAASSVESAQEAGLKPGRDGHYRFPRELTQEESDLIRALDRAASRPGFNFVALKWFRDVVLPEERFAWAQSESARNNVLREAIEKRLVLTGRIPNPRSPQFPVTTIQLNRQLPAVQAILGTSGPGGEDFSPVEIRGESLSTTILRERQ